MQFTERKEIESIAFAARANIASDLRTFLNVIDAEPAVVSLQNRLRNESTQIDDLLSAIRHLIDLEFDADYENPADAAVATYGWIIASVYPKLDGLVSNVLGSLPNSWWSNQLAETYLSKDSNLALIQAVRVDSDYAFSKSQNYTWDRLYETSAQLLDDQFDSDKLQPNHPRLNILEASSTICEGLGATLYRNVLATLGTRAELSASYVEMVELKSSSNLGTKFTHSTLKADLGLRVRSDDTLGRNINLIHGFQDFAV